MFDWVIGTLTYSRSILPHGLLIENTARLDTSQSASLMRRLIDRPSDY